jgi:hypothetical protein
MPIKPIVLQRRHAELGRIRLGHKAATQNGGSRPAKLAAFRFTSPSERYIRDLAELYGGEPRPWDNGGKPEFEVFTEAKSIPVIAIKGGLSQWLETWSGGGCIHRCDGEVNVLTNTPCGPEDPNHVNAKPTTRLSVMLPELEAIGAWRMESKGWNAAAEIPAVAELAQFVGDMVPAHLNLVERRSIKDGKTSRFVVPVLDLHIGTARLREIVAAKAGLAELDSPAGGAQPAALPSGSTGRDAYDPYFEEVARAATLDELQDIWTRMVAEHLVGTSAPGNPAAAPARIAAFTDAFKAAAALIKADADAAADPDGAVDAEVVEPESNTADAGEDPDAVWQLILAEAGRQGISLPDLEDDFAQRMGGLSSGSASAAEMRHYLGLLQEGAAA